MLNRLGSLGTRLVLIVYVYICLCFSNCSGVVLGQPVSLFGCGLPYCNSCKCNESMIDMYLHLCLCFRDLALLVLHGAFCSTEK